jgi:hypothetical protein
MAILFWPTLFKYDKMTYEGNSFPIRINRITGYTEMFRGKWLPSTKPKKDPDISALPYSEKAKVTGNAGLTGHGFFKGDIYNGSNWHITKIRVEVIAKESDGKERWNREFEDDINLTPLTAGHLLIRVAGDEDVGSTEWNITGVWGYQVTD